MTRRGLGKGLAALIPSSSPPTTSIGPSEQDTSTETGVWENTYSIPVASINPNPLQPRSEIDPNELVALAESIKSHGILQPIVVRRRGDTYEIIAGERRWRAAQQAGLREMPAIVKDTDDQSSLLLALIENLQREDINCMDAAKAYQRLAREFNLTQEQIAKHVGKSRSAIANTLRLLELPGEVQEALSSGFITEGHARALLALGERDLVLHACKQIIARDLSVRQVESMSKNIAKRQENRKKQASTPRQEPHILAIEEKLRQRFQTNVAIHIEKTENGSQHAGQFQIDFYSDDEFERILECLLGTTNEP